MNMEYGFLEYKDGEPVINKRKTTTVLTNRLYLDVMKQVIHYANGELLDVGCGESPFYPLFIQRIDRYFKTDILTSPGKPEIYSTVTKLPFKDESFDTILCTHVLEHVFEPFCALAEMNRTLRYGGVIILGTPFIYWIHEAPVDYFRYTKYFYQKVAKMYDFEIIFIKEVGGILSVLTDILSKGLMLLSSKSKYLGFLKHISFVVQDVGWVIMEKVLRKDFAIPIVNLGYVVVFRKR
jgi:SAM-dependent methyltransferase